jgi:hypothetical protein
MKIFTMATQYKNIIKALSKIAHLGPNPPKNYNYHKMIPSPMTQKSLGDVDVFMKPLELKSEKYKSLVSGIPIPTVLKRHCLVPNPSLISPIGKVIGFRIEVKGRTGSRSARRIMHYGVLNSGKTGAMTGSYLDFAKSTYVTKRGATGVKVWIAYASK